MARYGRKVCTLQSISYVWCSFYQRIIYDNILVSHSYDFTPPIRKILYLNYKWVNFITGIQLPIGTKIGRGLKFPHYSCIVISKRAIIGNNCTIYQGVTLGKTASGCPVLGNNVIVCANATIVGKVNIGDNAFIGAGAVVVHDVPANSVVVVGNPGRVISCKGIEIGKTYL